MTGMIHVTVNGKKRELEGPKSVLVFLTANDIDPRLIAVAHNSVVLHKDEYEQVVLKEGDSLEIVRMVGGG